MYESRFGISAAPFQLAPDPAVYFDSQGHHRAFDALRAGLEGDCGLILVSGDIGAGKTTLVRRLLAEADARQVAIAQVAGFRLDADDLLRATCAAFGVDGTSRAPEEGLDELVQALQRLRAGGRRALLIVDEAQNLPREALDALLDLLHAAQSAAPLRVALVGQPELARLFDTPAYASLKAHVRASCHLGPLRPEETGPYIEHRLRQVGWSGRPAFDSAAFDEIHRWTNGIPRRINALCDRLMLSCFLNAHEAVDGGLVARTAREWRSDIGETGPEPPAVSCAGRAAEARTIQAPPAAPTLAVPATRAAHGALLCVVAGRGDHVKAAALMRALGTRAALPATRLVRMHDDDALSLDAVLFAGMDMGERVVPLRPVQENAFVGAFADVVGRLAPSAIVVFDGSEAAFAAATVGRAEGVPVIHVGAGVRSRLGDDDPDAGAATDRLADLLYTVDAQASDTLEREGFAPEQVHFVGNLLVDAMQTAMRSPAGAGIERRGMDALPAPASRNGYAMAVLSRPRSIDDRPALEGLLDLMVHVSRDIPVVSPIGARLAALTAVCDLERVFSAGRITRVGPQSYPEYLHLLRHATCVLTDSWTVQEEAAALGVPCLTIGSQPAHPTTVSLGTNIVVGHDRALITRAVWDCIFNGGRRDRVPALWDGRSALRIAGYLGTWLPSRLTEVDPVSLIASTPVGPPNL